MKRCTGSERSQAHQISRGEFAEAYQAGAAHGRAGPQHSAAQRQCATTTVTAAAAAVVLWRRQSAEEASRCAAGAGF